MIRRVQALLAICLLLLVQNSWAHKASDSYLQMQQDGPILNVVWDVALRDLDALLFLDSNQNGQLTWGEIRTRSEDIETFLQSQLTLQLGENRCEWLGRSEPIGLVQHSDGFYAAQHWLMSCNGAQVNDVLTIDYRLLKGIDSLHRGLLSIRTDSGFVTTILRPDQGPIVLDGNEALWHTFTRFLEEGVHHLLTGYDHVLFLLCLLLPACLTRKTNQWLPSQSFRSAFLHTAGIVTAFTVAHSVTLALAALQLVNLPSRWVESAIAASIILAAVHTVKPILIKSRALIAGVFGLIHGFGFAGVLHGLPLTTGPQLSALAGFNVGVELGQLLVVVLVFPLLWWSRNSRLYRQFFMPFVSVLIALVALLWLLQRVFEWQLIPG